MPASFLFAEKVEGKADWANHIGFLALKLLVLRLLERYVAPMDKPDGLWLVTLIHSVESCLRERVGNTRVFLEERERKEGSQCLCVRVAVC